MKLFIKNMVNLRSLVLVETELEKLGIRPLDIIMGEAEVQEDLSLSSSRPGYASLCVNPGSNYSKTK